MSVSQFAGLCHLFPSLYGINLSVEQADCEEKRECVKQILTIRLLCDYAKKKRVKLFLLYIDFERAYDKVPRKMLRDILKSLVIDFYLSLQEYTDIKLLFKLAVIQTAIGVRQGAASSCLLFIIFRDVMVKMINLSENDGFLKSCHIFINGRYRTFSHQPPKIYQKISDCSTIL